MLRVLIAEDSPVIQRTLTALLEGENGIEIVGVADNGATALQLCKDLRPDLVTMDIFMPEMDGLEATRRIMEECPTRIVIISSMVGERDIKNSFEAIRSGALEVIEKPRGVLTGNYSEVKKNLIKVLKNMSIAKPAAQLSWLPPMPSRSEKKVVLQSFVPPAPSPIVVKCERSIPTGFRPEIVVFGGSTGAPTVILEVLSALPSNYPFPILVAQHISRGFGVGYASWLDTSSELKIRVAQKGETPIPGTVLIAPDDVHMEVNSSGRIDFIRPSTPQEHVPSVDRLFLSAARVHKSGTLGVLLSGMGRDGAQGIAAIYNENGVTLGQNEKTSVVYGMASVAAAQGVIMREVSPPELVRLLLDFAG